MYNIYICWGRWPFSRTFSIKFNILFKCIHMRIIWSDRDIYDCSGCMMSHDHSLDGMHLIKANPLLWLVTVHDKQGKKALFAYKMQPDNMKRTKYDRKSVQVGLLHLLCCRKGIFNHWLLRKTSLQLFLLPLSECCDCHKTLGWTHADNIQTIVHCFSWKSLSNKMAFMRAVLISYFDRTLMRSLYLSENFIP